jgi:hypothetical protein
MRLTGTRQAQRLAVDMHCAGAAGGNAAAIFRAGEPDFIAQHPQQRRVVFDIEPMGRPVHS